MLEFDKPDAANLAEVAVAFEKLTKHQLLNVMQFVPQHFWPPRPSHQSKSCLQWMVVRAVRSGRYEFNMEHAADLI